MKFMALLWVVCCGWSAVASAGVGEWSSAGIPGGSVSEVEYIGDGVALAITSGGIYRTGDHGATWVLVRAMRLSTASIAINRANPDQVLVTADGPLRSVNRGVSFSPFPLSGVYYGGLQFVAGFSRDGFYAWIIGPGGDVWRSTDGGANWTPLAKTLPAGTYWSLEADPSDHDTLYVSQGAVNFVSRDAGSTWTLVTAPDNNFFHIRASRATAGTIFGINTQGNALSRSVDYGANWAPISEPGDWNSLAMSASGFMVAGKYDGHVFISGNEGVSPTDRGRLPSGFALRISVDPANDEHILVATAGGIFGSDNRGFTWSERNAGLVDAAAVDIAVARDGTNAVYVATHDLGSVYRRDPATGTYSAVGRASAPTLGFPGMYGYRIAVAPQNGNTLYMLREGHLGRSADGGSSWTRLTDLPLGFNLTLDPLNPQVAYVSGQQMMMKTVNGGATWTSIGAGLPVYYSNGVGRLYVDPVNTANVYALVIGGSDALSPVYKSTDGGVTFAPAGWSGPTDFYPHALAFEPGRPSTIYLTAEFGFYKSVDSGASWTSLNGSGQDVIVDPQSPTIVYSAGAFRGIRRSVDGGATWTDLLSPVAEKGIYGFPRIALVPGHNAKLVAIKDTGGVYEIDVAPQLGLTLAPATLTAGTFGSFTLTVRNEGVVAATRVRVTTTLPASAVSYDVQGGAGGCTLNQRELSCDIGTLAPAAAVSATVSLTPTTAGSTNFSISAYETLSPPGGTARALVVQNAPSSSSGGGGGGGGRLDYLLLGILGLLLIRSTPLRCRFPAWASALKKH
jgi:uncharacterized repeat protein (TIGR01451 family)